MDVNMLLESIRESLHQVGVFLPRLLLAIVILIIGWVIAKAARFAVVKALRAINFSVVTEKAGVDHFLKQGGAHIDTVRVLGSLSYWLVILAALMIASNSLDLAYVTDLIGRIVLFVPKVMVAVVILVFGVYFARFVGAALTTYLRNIGVGEAGLVGRLALYAIVVFVIMIALDQMGLGDIIRQAFLIIVAAIALGLALAFGLGGQKRAAELNEPVKRERCDQPWFDEAVHGGLAGPALPAGRDLGRGRRELRAVFRARRRCRAVPVRPERPPPDRAHCAARADRSGLALLPAGRTTGAALRLSRSGALRSAVRYALQSEKAAARSVRPFDRGHAALERRAFRVSRRQQARG